MPISTDPGEELQTIEAEDEVSIVCNIWDHEIEVDLAKR